MSGEADTSPPEGGDTLPIDVPALNADTKAGDRTRAEAEKKAHPVEPAEYVLLGVGKVGSGLSEPTRMDELTAETVKKKLPHEEDTKPNETQAPPLPPDAVMLKPKKLKK